MGRATPAPPVARLARFTGATLTDPAIFGGGEARAQVGVRVQTVAYGYLGVVEGYVQPDTGAVWSTLVLGLPCPVPALALDHRSAIGRPGVPFAGAHRVIVEDPPFDDSYLVTSPDPDAAAALLTVRLCDVLIRRPVQRLTFDGPRLLVRTFDGFGASAEVARWLSEFAAAVLAATPAFVTRVTGVAAPSSRPDTFPPGLYGWGSADDSRSDGTWGATFAGRFAFAGRRRD